MYAAWKESGYKAQPTSGIVPMSEGAVIHDDTSDEEDEGSGGSLNKLATYKPREDVLAKDSINYRTANFFASQSQTSLEKKLDRFENLLIVIVVIAVLIFIIIIFS